jgi:hypothetical protein
LTYAELLETNVTCAPRADDPTGAGADRAGTGAAATIGCLATGGGLGGAGRAVGVAATDLGGGSDAGTGTAATG